jgi:hypothetical protein
MHYPIRGSVMIAPSIVFSCHAESIPGILLRTRAVDWLIRSEV